MSETDRERKALITKRGQIKGKLTRFKTFLDDLSDETAKELQFRLDRFLLCLDEFDDIQGQLELLDDTTDSNERVEFETSYFSLRSRAHDYLQHQHKNPSDQQTTQHSQQIAVKLPTINLPTFNGLYEQWMSFYDSFTSLIDKDTNLSDIQKLQYLKSSLKGQAAEVVQNIELTAANYKIAFDLLKHQFHNKRLIIQNHIKALFDLPQTQGDNPNSLRQITNRILTNMRGINALEINTEHWDPIIVHLVTSKLDVKTHTEWELTTKPNVLPTLQELLDFLQKRSQSLEAIENKGRTPTQQFKQHFPPNQKGKDTKGFKGYSKPTGSYSHVTRQVKACALCKQNNHMTYQCRNLLQASQPERIKILDKANICLNCLCPGHHVQQCNSKGCRVCNEKHNTALHGNTNNAVRRDNTISKTPYYSPATEQAPI